MLQAYIVLPVGIKGGWCAARRVADCTDSLAVQLVFCYLQSSIYRNNSDSVPTAAPRR